MYLGILLCDMNKITVKVFHASVEKSKKKKKKKQLRFFVVVL